MDDKNDLAGMLNNKNILNNLRDGLPYPYTVNDAEEYITAMLSADKTKTFAFAITLDDVVIGSISVFRCDNIHSRTAEMGYYIGESYWGKGLGTSAVKQICKHIFEHTDIIRIFAEPFAYNTASCRVLEKAGFQYEGTLHSNAVKNGSVLDMKMYALVKGQVAELNKVFVYTDGKNQDFVALCHALDAYLNNIVGGEENRAQYIPYNALDDIHDAIVIYDGDKAIGCASFKRYDNECAEVKRVFICEKYRGQGLAKKLMELLEQAAREKGYSYFILESGEILVEAMSLYRKIGYKVIPNYGQYKDMAESVCMKKEL